MFDDCTVMRLFRVSKFWNFQILYNTPRREQYLRSRHTVMERLGSLKIFIFRRNLQSVFYHLEWNLQLIDLFFTCSFRAEFTTSRYFLPHHAVVNNNSITTRLRVVFDGSTKTDTGISLNNVGTY